MSYKTELQSNNIDLQKLIDLANSLPEKENLDVEMATQDNLIAQIMAALDSKMGLINFTIAGVAYQAEKDMTWAQWVESDYNIDDFTNDGDAIADYNINWYVGYNNVLCLPSDTIIDGRAYVQTEYGDY